MSILNRALKSLEHRLARSAATLIGPVHTVYGFDVYEDYPRESINNRCFYNFGAGAWRHPFWQNVAYVSDHYGSKSEMIDVRWDAASGKPLEIESDTAELIYCSHTVGHLLDGHVHHMLREAHRVLKPGGVIRITTPNAAQFYWAYRRRDLYFNYHYGHPFPFGSGDHTYSARRMSIWIVNEIATQLVQGVDGERRTGAKLFENIEAIDQIFDESPTMEAAFSTICGMIDFDHQSQVPGQYVNWWTYDKLAAAYRAGGFKHVIPNVAGGSISPAMRDPKLFDLVDPTFSIFLDAIK